MKTKQIAVLTLVVIMLLSSACISLSRKRSNDINIPANLDFMIVFVKERKDDAEKAKSILLKHGFEIEMNETSNSGNDDYIGKIFAGKENMNIAKFIAKAISDIEEVECVKGIEYWDDFDDNNIRLWLVN